MITLSNVQSFVAAGTIALAMGPLATAQCSNQWLPGVFLPTLGPDSSDVGGATMWDPDGGGPLAELLVVGNEFGVFTWNGSDWRLLGNPGESPTGVRVLAVHAGNLYAGGDFFDANKRHLAMWNGNGWVGVGGSAGVGEAVATDFVSELLSWEGTLVIGGHFATAGGSPMENITRWNGAAFLPFAAGFPAYAAGDACSALAQWDPDGPGGDPARLFAGSSSGGVRWWNSTSWWVIAGLPTTACDAIAIHNQTLYAGGRPRGFNIQARVYWWSDTNGGWQFLPPFDNTDPIANQPRINSLISWGSQLYAAGRFNQASGFLAYNIVWLNGTDWLPLGTGLGGTNAADEIHAVAASQNLLSCVGSFNALINNTKLNGVAQWNGVVWSPTASPGSVYALSPFGSKTAIGGWFTAGEPVNGSAAQMFNIATWDGVNASPLGGGVNGPVRAMREFGSTPTLAKLAVGGEFTSAGGVGGVGGVAANRVALWSQSATNPLQTGWSAMGSGFNAPVYALEIGYQGVLIAGGAFTASGPPAINRMARWSTSTNQWLPFATAGGTDMNGNVHAIKVYTVSPTNPLSNVVTVAGGAFTTANGVAANRVAMWIDNPSAGSTPWAAMGQGFNNTVYALERYSGSIYAGGGFTQSGAFTVNRIARWTGGTWISPGNGIGFDGPVYALRVTNGFLYAAGAFTSVDGVPAKNIARYNGTAWSAVDVGVDRARYAIAGFNGETLFGGDPFQDAAANPVSIHGVERFAASLIPWISQQPFAQIKDCGQSANFTVTPASGYESGMTFAWRKGATPLSDGPTGIGSTLSGATTATLTIANVRAGDAGSYDCVITNACGGVTSTAATLTVNGTCCLADIAPIGALDGQVNVADLLAVITAWGTCASCTSCPADIAPAVHDCQVNVADLLTVITNWGPCP